MISKNKQTVYNQMLIKLNISSKKFVSMLLCLCMLLSLAACSNAAAPSEPIKSNTETQGNQSLSLEESKQNSSDTAVNSYKDMRVHFLDVGQGDCAFVELSNGQTMLIDAGNAHNANDIIQYIKKLQYTDIDYVVATHPHADHIGGMADVLKAFSIGDMYMPNQSHTSKTFENLVDTIAEKNIPLHTAKTGVNIVSNDLIKIECLSPSGNNYQNLNNCSAVVKLTYGETVFLFTGDAEQEIETELLNLGIQADVLKVGHHGSKTSSSIKFINTVSPKAAVISCGVDNSYGHPNSQTLATLKNVGADIYRTDEVGTVTVIADAHKHISVDKKASAIKENAPPPAESPKVQSNTASKSASASTVTVYRTNTGKKYHRDGCSYLKSKIKTTVSEARSMGLTPCSRCNPPE